MSIYKMKYHIDISDVDFNRKLKLSTLFTYFQDIASIAASELGLGVDTLAKEYGVAWILMKIRADIVRMPNLDEEITIETWPLEPKKIEFERDFIVRDGEGNVIIRAISSWALMDLVERKLRRSNSIPVSYVVTNSERAIDQKLSRLKSTSELELVYDKVIGYSDVDLNGHLNNSRYVDYIMDCFTIEEHKKYEVRSIEVHFTNEALPGDTISLQKDLSTVDEGLIYIEGVAAKTEQNVFRSQIKIEARE